MHWSVDVTNPGEVLACAGLAYVVDASASDADRGQTGFEYAEGQYLFQAPDETTAVLEELLSIALDAAGDGPISFGPIRLDWWMQPGGLNSNLKLWAGRQKAATVFTNVVAAAQAAHRELPDPFQLANGWEAETRIPGGQQGHFTVDPRGCWTALEAGFSLNDHSDTEHVIRPIVELAAFLGLQAFPMQGDRATGFRYGLWQRAPLDLAALAFAGVAAQHTIRQLHVSTVKQGQNTVLTRAEYLESQEED